MNKAAEPIYSIEIKELSTGKVIGMAHGRTSNVMQNTTTGGLRWAT